MSALHPVPPRTRTAQLVLDLTFSSRSGQTWRAIGGGSSFADAVAFARESLPLGHDWRLVACADLYDD